MMKLFGISKGGIHTGKLVSAVSALAVPFIPAGVDAAGQGDKSAIQILMGGGTGSLYSTLSISQRAQQAAAVCLWNGLGWRIPNVGFPSSNTDHPSGISNATKGICGVGVLAGVGLTVAGKFANPMLSGSVVKL